MHLVCTHYEIDILSVAVYVKTLRLKEGESFFFFFATPRGMWDLSSPARDGTWATCSGSLES